MIDLKEAKKMYEATTQSRWEVLLWPNGEFEIRASDGPQDTAYGNICATPTTVKEGREDECFANGTFIGFVHEKFPSILSEIEALRWLVEVLEWKPRGTYGRCMGSNGWYKQKTWPDRQESYNKILAKALHDAGYGYGE